MQINLEIKGAKKLIETFDERKLQKWVFRWIQKVLVFLESKAIPSTPIISWHLRKWYNSEQKNDWGKLYNDVEYAFFVHNWTKFIKANPFLDKVATDNTSKAGSIMNKEILKTLNFL